MGDYTERSSRAELDSESVLAHNWTWPKHTVGQLPPVGTRPMSAIDELDEHQQAEDLAAEEAAAGVPEEKRTKTGGRKKGTPNKVARVDIMKSAKIFSLRALGVLVDIMENEKEPGAVRVSAANSVLERAFGKAKQITEIGGFDGGDIQTKLTIEFVGAPGQGTIKAAVPPLTDGNIVDGVVRIVQEPQQAVPAKSARPWE